MATFSRLTRVWIYALCVCAGFVVVVVMAAVDTCAERDDSKIAYVQVGALRLEYVSERIMAMKVCQDARAWLPPILLVLYIGILALFLETKLEWQKELNVRQNDSVWALCEEWGGIFLLALSAVGLGMVIVFDHTGVHRDWHGVGVVLMLLGLAGVYMFTIVYESIYNLRMHSQRYNNTVTLLITITHIVTVTLFVTCLVLFAVAWVRQLLSVAVLCEYIILLLIFILAVISMIELAVMQHDTLYKAPHEQTGNETT
jgi:amino acid transporter